MAPIRTVFSCIATLALLSLPRPADAADNDARVLTGDAGAMTRHNPHMPWRAVAANGRIAEVVELRCEKRCTVQADADNTVELEPGAIVAFRDHFFVPLVPVSPMTRARQLELVEGRITIKSSARPTSKPIVVLHETSYFALRAGRALLTAKGHDLYATTRETAARYSVRRAWSTLEPHHSIALNATDKPQSVENPAIPQWDLEEPSCPAQPLSFAQRSTSGVVGACWKPIPGATSYRLEFAIDPAFTQPIEVVETNGPSWAAKRATGRWFGRVLAVSDKGFEGEVSEPRAFGVITTEMPPGSTVDAAHHALVLPEGERLRFPDPAELLVAIDNGSYQALPGAIKPEGETPHRLRFRYEGQTKDSGSYLLQLRQLRANISMTPRVARWPTDPVEVTVRLEDPSGAWDPSAIEPRLQVLVGITEMKVDWGRSGATWVARIPPRDMAGPVVLRVIARDEFGQQLGRNFLEVGYRPGQRGNVVVTTPSVQVAAPGVSTTGALSTADPSARGTLRTPN